MTTQPRFKYHTFARFERMAVALIAVRPYAGSYQYKVRFVGDKGKRIHTGEFYVMESKLSPFGA